MAIGLFGIMIESVTSSLLSWTGLTAQFLSGGYMLLAAVGSVRESGAWQISLEAALKQSEERLALALSAIQIGMFDWDLTRGSVLWTQTHEAILGYAPTTTTTTTTTTTEHPYSRWADRVHPDDLPIFEEEPLRCMRERKPLEIQYRIVWPDGSLHWVETKGVFQFGRDNKAKRMFGVVVDITERKRAENDLHESESRLRSVLDNSGDVIYRLNIQSGSYEYISPSSQDVVGFTPDELMALNQVTALAMIHPEDLPAMQAELARFEDTGKGLVEYRQRTKNGDYRWISNHMSLIRNDLGQPLYRDGSIRDITEGKLAVEAVSRSQKIFSNLIEHSPFGTYIVDSQFRIAMMNTASQTGAFRNVQPVIGRNFAEVMRIHWPEEVAEEIIGNFRHTLDTGEAFYSCEFINPRQDTEIVEGYEWELHRMTLPDGLFGVICYYYDSTELRQAEAALRMSEERFRSVVENLSEGLMLFNPQGEIIYQNPVCMEIHSYSKTQNERIILEKLPTTWQWWDDKDRIIPFDQWPVSRVFRGECFQNQVLHARRSDTGKEFDASYNGTPVYDAAGKLVLGFITIRDITEQRKAEIALRESEERFRVAQELSPDGFTILRPVHDAQGDIEDFTCVYANATIARLTGTDQNAVVGRRLLELLPGLTQSPFHEAYIQVATTGTPCVLEASYRGDSVQTMTWLRVAVVPIGRDIAILAQDITARKQAEKETHQQSEAALLLSEKEFRSLAEAMPQIVWATRPDGWNIYFNQQWVEYTGLTMEESYGHGWNTPFHPDDKQRAWDAWQRATQINERYALECRLRRADGVYRWWLVRGEPMRGAHGEILKWFGTCTDIEDLKRAETVLLTSNNLLEQLVAERTTELIESENQFKVLTQNLQSAVALINESGEFTIVNRAFLRIFELDDYSTIKNVNDRDWRQWQVFNENGSLLDLDEHPVRKAALTGKPVRDMLVAVKAPENPILKWILVSTEPILDAQSHIHRIICTYHDITDRKRDEEAMKTMNEELEERVAQRTAELRERDQMLLLQSRQAAMGEMIGNIAHQWRQPLNTLGLSIQQLELYYELGEFTEELLAKSVESSMDLIEYMSKTIDDFRNYFKPDKEKAEFKVREAVENTLTLIGDSFKNKHIVVEVTVKGDPVIYGHRNEFAQGILNILNNAGDVFSERETPQPKVTITFGIEGDHSFVIIADNGGGIPEEIMDKVFDPYFTTKGPQQGTGVGLYMSKTIIEKNMGGKLSVKNIAHGAEFRIEV